MKHPALSIKDPYGFTVEERLIAIEQAIRDGASSSVPIFVHCILDALDPVSLNVPAKTVGAIS